MTKIFKNRSLKLRSRLQESGAPALLLSSPANVAYTVGISKISSTEREFFVLITLTQIILISSALRPTPPKVWSFAHEILGRDNRLSQIITRTVTGDKLLVEAEDITMAEAKSLEASTGMKLQPVPNWCQELREIKDKLELTAITTACRITHQAWQQIKTELKVGVTETQLAERVRQLQLELGADRLPVGFEPIVAFGEHSAIPHHTPTPRQLKSGEVVLMDFGCTVDGYCSDFTRTIMYGDKDEQFIKVETAVLSAHRQALLQLKQPDRNNQGVDQVTYQVLSDAGFADQVLHTTGHGLGLSIHESPSLYRDSERVKLESGMVITIEPGLYFPGQFGYRHEDTVVLTKSGYGNLTSSPSQLQ